MIVKIRIVPLQKLETSWKEHEPQIRHRDSLLAPLDSSKNNLANSSCMSLGGKRG